MNEPNIKPVAFGESKPEDIAKGEPVLGKTVCPFCDGKVWISSIGYYSGDPSTDHPIPDDDRLSVHKQCLFWLFEQIMPAIAQNLKRRGM